MGNAYAPDDIFKKLAAMVVANGASHALHGRSSRPGVTTAPANSTDIAPDEQDTHATTTVNEDDAVL